MLMRIGMVLPVIATKNGTAKQCLELAKALTRNGHTIIIFTYAYVPRYAFEDFSKMNVRSVITIRSAIFGRVFKNPFMLERALLFFALGDRVRFSRMIQKCRLNIIHINDWLTMWIGAAAARSTTPLVATINDVPVRTSGFLNFFKRRQDRLAAKKVRTFMVLDDRNKKLLADWLDVPEKSIQVVRSGVDAKLYRGFTGRFDYKKAYGLNSRSFIIVCANMIGRHRHYEDVMRAVRGIGPAHVFILSKTDADPDYASELFTLAETLHIKDRIHFIDKYFSDKDRMSHIKGANLLIFPNYPQTWGLTVLEAMALGVPVIVSDGAGVSEILTHGKDSLVYPAGNVKKLHVLIQNVLQSRGASARVGVCARELVLSGFTWHAYAQNVANVYRGAQVIQ